MSDFIGMDPDVVRNLSDGLTAQAGALQTVTGAIDGLVYRIAQEWHGRDAEEFVGWWSQQHKPALLQAHDALAGLGRSARNNATQQDQTSSGVSAGFGPSSGPAAAAAGSGSVVGVAAAAGSAVGGGVVAAAQDSTTAAEAQTSDGPVTPGETTFLDGVVGTARSQLGNPSEPAYLSAAGAPPGSEWCAAFATWVLKQNGVVPDVPEPDSVQSWLDAAKSGHNGLSITTDPQPGDLVVYMQEQSNGTSYFPAHIGIMTSTVSSGAFSAISGNFNNAVTESFGGGTHDSIYGSVTGGHELWNGEDITLEAPIFIHVDHA